MNRLEHLRAPIKPNACRHVRVPIRVGAAPGRNRESFQSARYVCNMSMKTEEGTPAPLQPLQASQPPTPYPQQQQPPQPQAATSSPATPVPPPAPTPQAVGPTFSAAQWGNRASLSLTFPFDTDSLQKFQLTLLSSNSRSLNILRKPDTSRRRSSLIMATGLTRTRLIKRTNNTNTRPTLIINMCRNSLPSNM